MKYNSQKQGYAHPIALFYNLRIIVKNLFFIALISCSCANIFASDASPNRSHQPAQDKQGQGGLLDAFNATVSTASPVAGAILQAGENALAQANKASGNNNAELQRLSEQVALNTAAIKTLQQRPGFEFKCFSLCGLWCCGSKTSDEQK